MQGRAGVLIARLYRPVAFGLTVVLLAGALVLLIQTHEEFGGFGLDVHQYLGATRRWLSTGTPYVAAEVAGPFLYGPQTFLHPPIALYLFAPFTALPLVAWWALPIGVVVWFVSVWRPAPWVWPLLALGLAYPRFHGAMVTGNTDMWVCAGIAAGLRFGWPALVIAVKPSLAFLALVGARHHSWWVGALVVLVACLPLGALWTDWIAVVQNSPGDVTYSLPNVPWLLMPVVAWFGRTSHRPSRHPETALGPAFRSP